MGNKAAQKRRRSGRQSDSKAAKIYPDSGGPTLSLVSPEDLQEYTIEAILDSRISDDDGFDYLVHWKDYDASEDSWEPWEAVEETAVYEEFRKKHMRNPKHHFPPASAHRERKAPKRVEVVVEEMLPTSRPRRAFPPIPKPLIDIMAHPLILTRIIYHSSPAALAALLPCSKPIFTLTAPSLYRTLRMTVAEMKGLFEKGALADKRSSKPLLSGRGFSESAREALQHVRTLHLLEYGYSDKFITPRGCMADVEALVVHITPEWYYEGGVGSGDYFVKSIRFPNLNGTKHPQYIVRLPVCHDREWRRDVLHHLRNPSLPDITLLLPGEGKYLGAPQFGSNPRDEKRTYTFVLLPARPTITTHANWIPSSDRYWRNFPNRLFDDTMRYNICFVGAEYLGFEQGELERLRAEYAPFQADPAAHTLTTVPFAEWLDEQAPGTVFTAEEEVNLREADRELLAWAKKRVGVVEN